jgi:hypothetical protein
MSVFNDLIAIWSNYWRLTNNLQAFLDLIADIADEFIGFKKSVSVHSKEEIRSFW